jgi:hypothetical protein
LGPEEDPGAAGGPPGRPGRGDQDYEAALAEGAALDGDAALEHALRAL